MFWATVGAFWGVCFYTYYAREQVNKSQAANEIAKIALAEANKPYVLTNGFVPQRIADHKNVLAARIGVQWTNFGNTPAYSALPTICDPIARHDMNVPNFTRHVSESVMSQFVIEPKQTVTKIGPVIDDKDLLGTQDDSTAIYIFGKLDYTDGVEIDESGNRKSRVTWFCSRIVLPQPRTADPSHAPIDLPIEATMPVAFGCATVNCADDACLGQNLPNPTR